MRRICSWIGVTSAGSAAASASVLCVVRCHRSARMARASSLSRAVAIRFAISCTGPAIPGPARAGSSGAYLR
jgi:hypothetical protein